MIFFLKFKLLQIIFNLLFKLLVNYFYSFKQFKKLIYYFLIIIINDLDWLIY